MILGLDAGGWHGRIRRFSASVVLVFLVLFVWLRMTSTQGLDRFGNALAPDFSQFYVAGELAATGHIDQIYQETVFSLRVNALFGLPKEADSYPFLYPPFVPWLAVPLSWLPYPVAASFYLIAMCGLGSGLAWWVAKYSLADREETIDAAWLFVASIPVVRCVLYGQNGLLTLAVIWLGFLAWQSRRDWLCGAVFALGAFKPQLFVGVWLWLVLFGSNRARVGLMLGLLFWGGICWVGGVNGSLWAQWLEVITHVRDSVKLQGQMHSWLNAFDWWRSWPDWVASVRLMTWGLLLLGWIAVLARLRWRGKGTAEAAFYLALWGGVWLTPRFAQYDAVILYPALVWWWNRSRNQQLLGINWERTWIICLLTCFYFGDFFHLIKLPVLTIIGVMILINECRKVVHFRASADGGL